MDSEKTRTAEVPTQAKTGLEWATRQRYVFYGAIFLYAVYNCFWLVGTMFSFGSNDTKGELLFVVLTFLADMPVFSWIKANVKVGSLCLLVILIASQWLGESHRVLNWFTLLYWYGPKVVPWLAAVWAGRQEGLVGGPPKLDLSGESFHHWVSAVPQKSSKIVLQGRPFFLFHFLIDNMPRSSGIFIALRRRGSFVRYPCEQSAFQRGGANEANYDWV